MNLFRATIAPFAQGKPFFNSVLVTGSHAESVKAIVELRADVASIDCVTLAQLHSVGPGLAKQIEILAWTDESPGLPLITSASTDAGTVTAMRGVLMEIERDPNLMELRQELFIEGFEVLNETDYKQISLLEDAAVNLGYPKIC
jgi:ABC-type phosphate/phosphonate transport system substrate-binding protein